MIHESMGKNPASESLHRYVCMYIEMYDSVQATSSMERCLVFVFVFCFFSGKEELSGKLCLNLFLC